MFFLLVFFIFTLMVFAMLVGFFVNRKTLKGTCGGLNVMGANGIPVTCGHCSLNKNLTEKS